jgi:hypothetical protein
VREELEFTIGQSIDCHDKTRGLFIGKYHLTPGQMKRKWEEKAKITEK